MAKIIAPNRSYSGISAGIPFAAGVGETDNEYLIGWFRAHGYSVETEELAEEEDIFGDVINRPESLEPFDPDAAVEEPIPEKPARKKGK